MLFTLRWIEILYYKYFKSAFEDLQWFTCEAEELALQVQQ